MNMQSNRSRNKERQKGIQLGKLMKIIIIYMICITNFLNNNEIIMKLKSFCGPRRGLCTYLDALYIHISYTCGRSVSCSDSDTSVLSSLSQTMDLSSASRKNRCERYIYIHIFMVYILYMHVYIIYCSKFPM